MEMDLVKRNVRGGQVKAYHCFLTGDFGFWIISSEKPSDGRSHPSGCLSLWNVQKKSVSKPSRRPLDNKDSDSTNRFS